MTLEHESLDYIVHILYTFLNIVLFSSFFNFFKTKQNTSNLKRDLKKFFYKKILTIRRSIFYLNKTCAMFYLCHRGSILHDISLLVI